MYKPGVLESAKQAAADKLPVKGRSLGDAVSITLSSPSHPLKQLTLGQQLLLRLRRGLENLGCMLGVCFLQL